MASKAQLKAIRKKFHLGEFRKSHSTKRGVNKIMARRRRSRRYSGFRRHRRGRSRFSSGMSTTGIIGGAIAYGAVRQKISDMLMPLTSKIPLGTFSDEVGMGLLSYIALKKVSNPLVKKIALAGLTIESARVGEALISGGLGSITNTSSSSSGSVSLVG